MQKPVRRSIFSWSMIPCTPTLVVIVARTQKGFFIVDCVLRLMAEGDRLQGGGDVDRGEHRHSSAADAFLGDKEKYVSAAVECNPHLWQSNNIGLVDQKVSYVFENGMVSPLPCCGVIV